MSQDAPKLTHPAPVVEGRYEIRLARASAEVASALRLRYRVFSAELGGLPNTPRAIEFDEYDVWCQHLIVICRTSGETVGTYRLNTNPLKGCTQGFYSAGEFTIEDLPKNVLRLGVEIGRACIDKHHRNSKVLFLLWKGLMRFLQASRKRFFFGCCSMFTRDERAGAFAFRTLVEGRHLSSRYSVKPRRDPVNVSLVPNGTEVKIPSLFEMYLRLGAEVCGPPTVDREFGTVDFFVVFDITRMNEKYRRMFNR